MIYLIQNSQAVKKHEVSKNPWWKKMWNQRWGPRNGSLMAKNLIMTFQVNLCCLLYATLPNSPELSSLKFFLYWPIITFISWLDFTYFFIMAFLGTIQFFIAWLFRILDFNSFCNCMLAKLAYCQLWRFFCYLTFSLLQAAVWWRIYTQLTLWKMTAELCDI